MSVGKSFLDLFNTVEPRFNEPLLNKVLNITKNFLQPGQSYSKMYETQPGYNIEIQDFLACRL